MKVGNTKDLVSTHNYIIIDIRSPLGNPFIWGKRNATRTDLGNDRLVQLYEMYLSTIILFPKNTPQMIVNQIMNCPFISSSIEVSPAWLEHNWTSADVVGAFIKLQDTDTLIYHGRSSKDKSDSAPVCHGDAIIKLWGFFMRGKGARFHYPKPHGTVRKPRNETQDSVD